MGLLTGFVLGMTRLAANVMEPHLNPEGLFYRVILEPNWLHYSIYLFFLCIVVIVVVSFFTKPADRSKTVGLTYGSATPEQIEETRTSWNKWDVVHTVIILSITIAFYIYFW